MSSIQLMNRKYHVLSIKNPSNTPSYLYGPAGQKQYYKGKSTNLAKSSTSLCSSNQFIPTTTNDPQIPVKTFGLYMKNRITFGPAYNQSTSNLINQCCPYPTSKYKNIVKLLNQSHYDMSSYLKTRNTRAAECTINPDASYNIPSSEFYTHYTETENGITTTKCCTKPIDKITKTPDIETYLSAKYLKNKCLPPPPASQASNNTNTPSINTIKLRYNNIKGSSCEC